MIGDLKEDSNKQINEVRKSIQNLQRKIVSWKRNSSRKCKLLKNNQVMLEMKTSINHTKITVDSIISRQDQRE
jgi:hypothetical protein